MDSTSDPLSAERRHLEHLRHQIHDFRSQYGADSITMKIGRYSAIVSDVEKVSGNPKADGVFTNVAGQPVLYFSHKDGKRAKDYQQLGGVSHYKATTTVCTFAHYVKEDFPAGVSGGTVGMQLDMDDPEQRGIVMGATYGVDFNTGVYGINNVHVVIQGKMNLTPCDNVIELTASNVWNNGEVFPHDYMIYARRDKKRSDLDIPQTRVLLATTASRKVKWWV